MENVVKAIIQEGSRDETFAEYAPAFILLMAFYGFVLMQFL